MATSKLGIGDGKVNNPFMLVSLPVPLSATALRITVQGQGQITATEVSALGPAGNAS